MSYSKYGNRRTEIDGIVFASKAEAWRYAELRLRLAAGEIANLRLQPRYPLVVNGVRVCTYVADFAYTDVLQGGGEVCEDVKGVATAAYRIKRALMLAVHGIVIKEVRV